MSDLHEYHSLDGVKGGRLKGPMANTITGFRNALVCNRTCSAAGDHGAIQVWRDDAGQWRCAFMVYSVIHQSETFTSKAQAMTWVREWFPAMRGEPSDV